MKNTCTLGDYRIRDGSVLHMLYRLTGGGCQMYYVDQELFDPRFNFDFTDIKVECYFAVVFDKIILQDDGEKFVRGGKSYSRPIGCKRYAIKVNEKYEDNKWLGCSGDKKEWPVAYHGTKENNSHDITKNGFDLSKCKRFAYGRGIYCTPDPETAKLYATEYVFQGKTYRLIFQTRVNPKTMVVVKKADPNGLGEYWIVPENGHIRPYGVCVYPV
uniref:PARP catalytic domain-containing protein n=1 Tax=Panagrolaimus davidi TaxID=227884 RepID=A0A914PIR5_9BILA